MTEGSEKDFRDCCLCRHFRALPTKKLEMDFGYCINPESKHNYHVLFEHHAACEEFERIETEGKIDSLAGKKCI